jgi:cell division protein FtsX
MTSPRWARALLRRAVPDGELESVLGDLEEVHRRRVGDRGPVCAALATGWEALAIASAFALLRTRASLGRIWISGPELRLALRFLRRTPLISVTALLALALGLGLAATGFTVVHAVLDPELPWDGGDRFVEVRVHAPTSRGLRGRGPTLAELAAAGPGLRTLAKASSGEVMLQPPGNEAVLARTVQLPPDLLHRLPWRPEAGRLLEEGDRSAPEDGPRVALLGEALWERLFARDPGVVGRTLAFLGREVTVVGVLPREADFPVLADLWLPAPSAPLGPVPPGGTAHLVGVLEDGASPAQVEAYLATALAGEAGTTFGVGPRVQVRRFGEGATGGAEGALLLGLLVGLLLVVAGNVGNLMAARAAARRAEISIRSALGAGRGRIVAQLALEVTLLTAAAALLGLAASHATLSALAASEARDLPPWVDLGLGPATVVFTVGAALLATLFAGVGPALRASRDHGEGTLREAGQGATRPPFGPLHHAMVVLQVAAAVGVLGAAAVVYRGWIGGGGEALSLPVDRILVAQVAFPGPDGAAGGPRHPRSALQARVRALDDVEAVAWAAHLPGTDAPLLPVVLEGGGAPEPSVTGPGSGGPATGHAPRGIRAPRESEAPWSAPVTRVSLGYFDLLGIRPLAGRLLTESEFRDGAPPVAVVNASFVDDRLGGASPLGRRIRLAAGSDGTAGAWREIVGVVPDLGLSGVDGRYAGGLYLPLEEDASRVRLLVRTAGPPAPVGPALRAAAAAVGPGVTVDAVRVLGELLDSLRRVYLLVGSAVLGLGAVVLLLSLMGVYAILSFEVGRRTREIGIRLALGADRLRILRPVLVPVTGWVAAGSVLGTFFGLGLVEVVRGTLVTRFPPAEPWVFPLLWIAVLVTALLAALVPLRRVLAVMPAQSLRSE